MPTYLYKSKTGQTVNIYDHIVTVHPGLEFPAPNATLDAYIGVTLDRYTDGEEDATATSDFVTAQTDAATGGVSLVGGATVLTGELQTGEWAVPPSIFRLLLNGTGTVTLDSRDAAGVITLGVYSITLSGAVNQIDFPYAGDDAISIRATLTGTATAKVI